MTGPITGSPPSGPRGVTTALTEQARRDNYRKQTGGRKPTPRQQRRIRHKANRAVRSA